MPGTEAIVLSSIDCVNFVSSSLAMVSDNELVGGIYVHCQLHDFLDGVGVVWSSKVEFDIERLGPWKKFAAVYVREVEFVVHLVNWWVLVAHHNCRVGFSRKVGHSVALQKGIKHVGSSVVEKPHTVGIALEATHSPHKVSSITASVEHAEVEVGVIVNCSFHDILNSVVDAKCNAILKYYGSI